MAKRENYFKYWWKSSNEHGVHSPFVFNLLTKGLYPRDSQWKGMTKRDAFIPRIVSYYTPDSLAILGKWPLDNSCTKELWDCTEEVDMIYIESLNSASLSVDKLYSKMHNNSVLIIDRRKEDEQIEELWEQIVSDVHFSATIDFYYYGLAFVRTEQLKQHFVLRM